MSSPAPVRSTLEAAGRAASRAAELLSASQARDGHWCAELTADSTLESDYILFQLWLDPPRDGRWQPETRAFVDKAAAAILDRQLPDGGFNIYAEGPSEVSASVKAYFALKLAGIPVDDERMLRLRDRILELGGIQAANSYVRVNLSLFDLYPRDCCPSIPPEVVLLPFRFLYQMSSWTRAIVVSLSIVHAANPRRPVPAGFNLDEIWKPGVSPAFKRDGRITWHNFFLAVDSLIKWWERRGPQHLRRKAVARAEEWMVERIRHADGLGAIYPPMMYSVMALDVLGYAPGHPLRAEALRQFNNLMVDDGDRFFFQPCFSPVWDTAIGAYALAQQDPAHPALPLALDWLLDREVRRKGDWSVKRPHTEPSGWAFEYRNEFYPDIDDTAMAVLALCQRPVPAPAPAPNAFRPRSSAPSTGSWPCSPATAAGPPSTPTTTGSSSARFRSRITTPCSTPPAPISPAACSKRWPPPGCPPGTPPFAAESSGWCAIRRPMEAGTAVGASPIFTEPASPCAASPRPARAIAKPTSCAPANGFVPSRMPTEAGANPAPPTTGASSPQPPARLPRPPGPSSA